MTPEETEMSIALLEKMTAIAPHMSQDVLQGMVAGCIEMYRAGKQSARDEYALVYKEAADVVRSLGASSQPESLWRVRERVHRLGAALSVIEKQGGPLSL
jgi:hypothetical protein